VSDAHQPFLELRARQARRVTFDQEQADAGSAFAAGAHGNGEIIGAHARGDEGLLATHDIMVAIAPRAGTEIGDIGAAARLGDGERRDLFPRQHVRQHPRLHFGTRSERDRWRADAVAHQARADPAGAGARQLLARHDLHELVGRHAAIFLGKAEAEQADLGGLDIKRARKLAGLVPLMRVRLDLVADKAAHHLAKGFVLGGIERAFHDFFHGGESTMAATRCAKLASRR
jgi:hypothetical protein